MTLLATLWKVTKRSPVVVGSALVGEVVGTSDIPDMCGAMLKEFIAGAAESLRESNSNPYALTPQELFMLSGPN